MKLRKTLIAASIASLPLFMAANVEAATAQFSAPAAANSQAANALVNKLLAERDAHGVDSDHGYSVRAQHPGLNGTQVTRADHTYKGVRIFGSDSVVVSNNAGDIVSEVHSDRRQGLGAGAANKSLRAATAGFDVTPTISAQAAINGVVNQGIAASGNHVVQPTAELVVYPIVSQVRKDYAVNKPESALNAVDVDDVVTGYELAYLVKTRMANGNRLVYRDTIVSAKDGHQLNQWDALQTVVGTGNSQYNGTVPIQTTLSGSVYKMLDSTRGTGGKFGGMAITDAAHSSSSSPTSGNPYTNSTNTWGDGQQYIAGGSDTNANGQTAAVNALWGLMNTYDTMSNVMNWKSLDGANTATYIAVHVDNNYDNAFYTDTCKCMYIGDGSNTTGGFKSLGSIDVIGHEMGHGVTAATSNLTYSGESGGLNESSSDINGEMVEAYARNGGTGTVVPAGNDWMMGKEISISGQPLRWMWKPSKDGKSPDAWSSTVGSLNVHYSSGPNNRMFYFLSQGSNSSSSSEMYSPYLTKAPLNMTGIGNDHAYRIWFTANTTKFTSSTNYAGARTAMIAAAQQLYGVGSKEDIAVQRAYAAINVGADVAEQTGPAVLAIGSQPSNVSVAVGGTATFSVTATGGTSPYAYQWLRNGSAISGATAASYSLANAQSTDNGALFSVKVTDAANATVTSSAATLTVGTSNPVERVNNGTFEGGTTGWTGSTQDIGTFTGEPAYAGSKNAWMGGNGSTATETLTQSIAVPATLTSAKLNFYMHIDTAETTTTSAYDKMTVSLKNSSGTTIATLATYSNLNKATGYQLRTFDVTSALSAYKGQNVTLSFSMTEDSSLQTSFVLDNISLVTQ